MQKIPDTSPPDRIRVLFILGQFTFGGSERHVADMAANMDKTRFDPCVLNLRLGGPLADTLSAVDVRFRQVPLLSLPFPFWRVQREVQAFAPHVVSVYTYVDKLWGRAAGILARTPVVLSAYRTRRFPWYERLLLPGTTAVVANSNALRQEFHERYGYPMERLHVLPNGVDLERFAPRSVHEVRKALDLPGHSPLVAMVARFAPVKGHEVALDAFAAVKRALPDAIFILMGHGGEEGRIKQRVQELGLQESVRFLPPDTDAPLVYAAADVVALSSHSESLPRVLVEAAACGRPAVATAVGGCSEIIEDGQSGYIVPPGDAATLAARLVTLLSEPDRARRMGNRAHAIAAARFSMPAMVAAFESLCSQLLMKNQHVR